MKNGSDLILTFMPLSWLKQTWCIINDHTQVSLGSSYLEKGFSQCLVIMGWNMFLRIMLSTVYQRSVTTQCLILYESIGLPIHETNNSPHSLFKIFSTMQNYKMRYSNITTSVQPTEMNSAEVLRVNYFLMDSSQTILYAACWIQHNLRTK